MNNEPVVFTPESVKSGLENAENRQKQIAFLANSFAKGQNRHARRMVGAKLRHDLKGVKLS